MFRVDPRCLVGLVRQFVGSTRLEECIIGVEHLPCQDLEPFPCKTTSVNTLFIIETDTKFAIFNLFARLTLQIQEAIFENTGSTDIQLQGTVMFSDMWSSVQLLVKVVALVVKVENTRIVDQ